jgi:hypothetical protein
MDFNQRMNEINELKLTTAVRQLGAFTALMDYAINSLRGNSVASNEDVARYLENRVNELTQESNRIIFNHKLELV